jgi:hypothetical protein
VISLAVTPTAEGGALDHSSNQTAFRFVVTYSDQELRTYSKMMAGRHARAHNDGAAFGILLAAILLLGLAVLGAFKLGWVEPSAVRPVLYTAYFAFLTGAGGYYFVMRAYFRKFIRTNQYGGTWNYSFTPAGLCYRSETIEIRAVKAVEDLGRIVIVRFGVQGLVLPSPSSLTTPHAPHSPRQQPPGSMPQRNKLRML